MIKRKCLFAAVIGGLLLNACDDDDLGPGNPIMDVKTEVTSAFFGDSLAFTINASDQEVPLSTLKAQLYFGEEQVSETTIRTKVSGDDYSGKIFVPFYKDIPDGTATLKYVLQNISFTITEQEVDVYCSRPQYDHLILVTEDGDEYEMPRVDENLYEVTAEFPQQLNAYILAPAYGDAGNDITFGYSSGSEITEGSTTSIPFSALQAGEYTVSFNTLTYEASPFVSMTMNGEELTVVDATTYQIETSLEQGETIVFEDVPNYEEYWIDPDFFDEAEDGTLTFVPISGNYRVTVDADKQYFKVEVLDSSMSDATLQSDGTGTLYIVGGTGSLGTEAIGKPTYVGAPNWDGDGGAMCMSPIEPTLYQMTLVAGEQITCDGVNFKFYGGKNWADEYGSDRISTTSSLIVINDGDSDNGNVWLQDGVTLEEGATYVVTVDMSDVNNAILSMEKQ